MSIAEKYLGRETRRMSHDPFASPLSRTRCDPDPDRWDLCHRLVPSTEPRNHCAVRGARPIGVADARILAHAMCGNPHLRLNPRGNGSYAVIGPHVAGSLQSINHPLCHLGHGSTLSPPPA